MRFAPKPLVVGSPVAPNYADVASSLPVVWVLDLPTRTFLARLDGVVLRAGDGVWSVDTCSVVGTIGSEIAAGNLRGVDENKRAAVLALASHLCSPGEPSAGPVDARDRLVSAIAKSPAPPADEVTKIVEGRRPFAVGDRVRFKPITGSKWDGFIGSVVASGKDGLVDVKGYGLVYDHKIEHAAPSFTWVEDTGWSYDVYRAGTKTSIMRVISESNGYRWLAWVAGDPLARHRGALPTLDAAKAAAEAAYLEATR